jgi:small subunit ribosomal protein S8
MSTTTTDPISDMLTRIRNAIGVRKSEITLPHSKVKESLARLLQQNRFIDSVDVADATVGKVLTLRISADNSNARITEISRISRPGRREYATADKIPTVKRGRGVVIISTSKGLMTGDDAKKQGVGGELICKVY